MWSAKRIVVSQYWAFKVEVPEHAGPRRIRNKELRKEVRDARLRKTAHGKDLCRVSGGMSLIILGPIHYERRHSRRAEAKRLERVGQGKLKKHEEVPQTDSGLPCRLLKWLHSPPKASRHPWWKARSARGLEDWAGENAQDWPSQLRLLVQKKNFAWKEASSCVKRRFPWCGRINWWGLGC